MKNIFLPYFSILLLKTSPYNLLSILYSKLLGKNLLELGRKMYCILYWRLYCATNIPLYCVLYCTLYCKSYSTRTSKWLDYSFWNNTSLTPPCWTVRHTVHLIILTLIYIILYTVPNTKLYTNTKVAGWACLISEEPLSCMYYFILLLISSSHCIITVLKWE